MTISFDCPHCGTHFDVAEQHAGQTGPCRTCGQPITVPPVGGHPLPPRGGSRSGGVWVLLILLVGGLGLVACGGLLVALLIPAVSTTRPAVARMQCSNNLKQIALALHNYHAVHKTFPPAYIADQEGRPMHSWRTLILPYLEQQALYTRYDFHQPWDSPVNQSLVRDAVVSTYGCPSDSSDSTETSYVLVTGELTPFAGQQGIQMGEITDGTSNTIAVVEIQGSAIHWAEPRDIDLQEFLQRLGQPKRLNHAGGVNAAMFDGSVRFLSQTTDVETLQNLVHPRDGNPVQLP